MAMKRCADGGHMYDATKHTMCPHCTNLNIEIKPTRGIANDGRADQDEGVTGEQKGSPRAGVGQAETVGLFQQKHGSEPVVGWLVCIEGPDRGSDYRIHSAKNFVGRSPEMDIRIKEDPAVSRDKHAIIAFDPKNNAFTIAPGDSRGMVYHNEAAVHTPTPLAANDVIELGESKLMFVPLCGESFSWD